MEPGDARNPARNVGERRADWKAERNFVVLEDDS